MKTKIMRKSLFLFNAVAFEPHTAPSSEKPVYPGLLRVNKYYILSPTVISVMIAGIFGRGHSAKC